VRSVVNLLSCWFGDRRKIATLQAEIEELKEIIRALIPSAERAIDYRIAGDYLYDRYKELKGIGIRRHAGVS
jgi:hypothetical protein